MTTPADDVAGREEERSHEDHGTRMGMMLARAADEPEGRPPIPSRVALVLGGGGLKGFAHLGVLRALSEYGIAPSVYAGTSIGALIAAAWTGGMSVEEMARRAHSLRKRDLFRLNLGMVIERMQTPSLYHGEPLRALCATTCPSCTFRELGVPLLVNTVDIERGTRVVWGLPGLQDVSIEDAVYASCALPGSFPPGVVGGRYCVDGGTIDNLPAAIAAVGADAVIAVDVGSSELTPAGDAVPLGFAAIYMRAATVMMHALQQSPLAEWRAPPMLLIRPHLGDYHWFSFTNATEFIQAGYDAACSALDQVGDALTSEGGVYPRRLVELSVDRDRCIGCTMCTALAPTLMAMDDTGKAYPTTPVVQWSPADGDFVEHCPTRAIIARTVGEAGGRARHEDRRMDAAGD
ncbi:MAG TPA: patatin-like phospholipase family protein [Gemmatimonadaceae bacterium]|nr:patatin-like phospholipase family protein [Gemmatimonadaceae bacterium]